MVGICKALIVTPGGLGTCDEIFEVLTLMQTGKKERVPIILFGTNYWEKVKILFYFLSKESL